jgi:hypothetical protein
MGAELGLSWDCAETEVPWEPRGGLCITVQVGTLERAFWVLDGYTSPFSPSFFGF